METFVELEPLRFDRWTFVPDNATDAVYAVLVDECRDELASAVAATDFQSTTVTDRFHAAVDRAAPITIERTLQGEARVYSDQWKPLTRKLGELSLDASMPSDLRLGPGFVANAHDQIEQLPYDFSELQAYHQVWKDAGLIDLISDVNAAVDGRDTDPEWLNKAFSAIEAAANNPEAFTLPADKSDALFLIPFLPGYTRSLTRRLIVHHHYAAKVEAMLGDDISGQEMEMLAALKSYYRADILTGQHWDDPSKHSKLDDDISVEMGHLGIEAWDALGVIQQHSKSGHGERFGKVMEQVRTDLNATIDAISESTSLRTWQSTDTGHCFESFRDYVVQSAIQSEDALDYNFGPIEKSGLRAVILEDDDRQRAAWASMVENHSAFEIPEDLTFAEPEGVLDHAVDPNVGFFLLDIQNGDDKTAGIRVGEAIMQARLRRAGDVLNGDGEPLPPTSITIWSSSPEAVKVASDHFHQLVESLPGNQSSNVGWDLWGHPGRYGGNSAVNLSVSLKRWPEYKKVGTN